MLPRILHGFWALKLEFECPSAKFYSFVYLVLLTIIPFASKGFIQWRAPDSKNSSWTCSNWCCTDSCRVCSSSGLSSSQCSSSVNLHSPPNESQYSLEWSSFAPNWFLTCSCSRWTWVSLARFPGLWSPLLEHSPFFADSLIEFWQVSLLCWCRAGISQCKKLSFLDRLRCLCWVIDPWWSSCHCYLP